MIADGDGRRQHSARDMEIDRIARILIATWERVEHKPVNVSYIATFADMARAIIDDRTPVVERARDAMVGIRERVSFGDVEIHHYEGEEEPIDDVDFDDGVCMDVACGCPANTSFRKLEEVCVELDAMLKARD